jgi:Flp pilus assembly protein TadD
MNRTRSILIMLPLALALAGCATSPSSQQLTTALVQVAAYDAAFIGTQTRLEKHPAERPRFEAALATLNTLVDKGGSVTELRAALADIRTLDAPQSMIVADLVSVVIYTYASNVDLAKSPEFVRITIVAVRDGIRDGLKTVE